MKKISIFLFQFTTLFNLMGQETTVFSNKKWDAFLINDQQKQIPLRISLEQKENKQYYLSVLNSSETIELGPSSVKKDTLTFYFTDYNSEVKIYENKATHEFEGSWINLDEAGSKYRKIILIPKEQEDNTFQFSLKIDGNYKLTIHRDNNSDIEAVGTFRTNGNKITGTIRTKSGDYRFLEGTINGNEFYLSSFNGGYAFLLEGSFEGTDSLNGRIHSAKSSSSTVTGIKDKQFKLPEMKDLTKVINDKPFNLDLPSANNGKKFNFKKQTKNKVTIVSVFGTWCPNCIDEANLLQEMYNKYHQDGLQIINVAYEYPEDYKEQLKRVQRFINKKKLTYTFLIGGKATKENVMNNFPMIDNFSSYPTSFLIDKQGKIVEINTGFNGPGTGWIYTQYVSQLEKKIIKELSK